jgi:hypothetical protein
VVPPEGDEGGEGGGMIAEPPAEVLPSLLINDCIPAALVTERYTKSVELRIDLGLVTLDEGRRRLTDMETLFRENPGPCAVSTLVRTPDDVQLTLALGDNWRVRPSDALLGRLRAIWGERSVRTVVEMERKQSSGYEHE